MLFGEQHKSWGEVWDTGGVGVVWCFRKFFQGQIVSGRAREGAKQNDLVSELIFSRSESSSPRRERKKSSKKKKHRYEVGVHSHRRGLMSSGIDIGLCFVFLPNRSESESKKRKHR